MSGRTTWSPPPSFGEVKGELLGEKSKVLTLEADNAEMQRNYERAKAEMEANRTATVARELREALKSSLADLTQQGADKLVLASIRTKIANISITEPPRESAKKQPTRSVNFAADAGGGEEAAKPRPTTDDPVKPGRSSQRSSKLISSQSSTKDNAKPTVKSATKSGPPGSDSK